jgi:hypothetical protein
MIRWKRFIAVVVPIEVVLAALAWRDLGRRPDTQVSGSKNFWRVFVNINPGNSLAYWAFGRRRAAS